MHLRHPARWAAACMALATAMAGAQTVSRTAPSTGVSGMAGAASTVSGAQSAAAGVPVGTGTDGRAVIVITQPAPNGTNAMGAGPAAPSARLSAVDIAAIFLSADTNRDGELSRAEAQRAGLAASFDELDTNHDGVLSRFEFDEAFR